VDAWTAKQIKKQIQAAGAQTFLSEIDVEGGDEIGVRMKVAMRKAHECLVLYTPEAAQSKNVWLEIGAAWMAGKRVVLVLSRMSMDEVTGDARFPPYLKSLDFSDLNVNFDSTYIPSLQRRITRRRGPKPTTRR